jgi:flagellin-like hook-associated protein FlgL
MSTIGTIGALAVDQAQLRLRLDTLGRQVSTGQRGTVHGELGIGARPALDLRGEVARREAYVAAAGRALSRATTGQEVLGRLQALSADLAAQALRARTLGATGVEALARSAEAALEEAAALLNTRHGGEYLFAGSDVTGPPVPGAAGIATGPMASDIAAQVATLDPLNAAAVLAAGVATANAPATTPFSAFLEGPGATEARRAVQVADGERVVLGVLANRDSNDQVAQSWGREMLRGFAVLAALTPASAATDTGFDQLLAGVHGTLSDAASGLAAEQGVLGAATRRIEAARERHGDTLVALRGQLAAAEEVDLAAASSSLRQLQARLEASYEATGMLARLSLASLLR